MIVISGLILLVTGIVLGAFGAHALKDLLSPEKLNSFEVGVRYQIYHGLGLLLVGLNADKFRFNLRWTYRFLLTGVILFSASIYLLSCADVLGVSFKLLGPVTPIGGLLMITGWLTLIIRLFNDRQM